LQFLGIKILKINNILVGISLMKFCSLSKEDLILFENNFIQFGPGLGVNFLATAF